MASRLFFGLLYCFTCVSSLKAETVVISEFLASAPDGDENVEGVYLDDDGEPSDWIEIHNTGATDLNLAGYGLTDALGEIKFQFPEVSLDAGGYLVVFASGKDRAEPGAPLHTSFRLDRSGEYLALLDADGVPLTEFNPEYPGQATGVTFGLAGAATDLFAAMPEPTPGETNRVPPPVIEGTDFFPKPASPDEPLNVTATVRASGAPVSEVRLLSRVMFRGQVEAVMRDDGVAPDVEAGDHVYTAQISNRTLFGPTFGPGLVVRWAVEVTDALGNEARWPEFSSPENEEYTGTVLAHDPIATQLQVFHWFIEDPKAAETDRGARSVCYFNGELYDNLFTRIRGGTARSWPKRSFKVEFPEDHHFRFDPDLPRVDEFNLNATYTDKSYARAILTSELHQDSGTPAPVTFPLRVHQNGEFYSVALFVEQCDRDFLRRNNLDPDGAYYKANPGSFYTGVGSFEKKTRKHEGKEDVTAFVAGLRIDPLLREAFLMDHVDIPAQVNFMAGVAVTQNIDNSDKNHFLYRDTEGSGEFFMTPWDLDLTFGPDALNTDRILANEERRGAANPNAVHPFIGSRKFPLHAGKTNELLDRMFTTSRTRDMFLRRLRTLHDTFLATDYFDRRLDELLALYESDTVDDREKWGGQSHFPGARDDMATTIERIKTEYLIDRRDFFERGGSVEIPGPMPEEVNMVIGEIEFAPASGNQAEEYIQLKNPNRFAVDLSGWRLEGAVEHVFRPGTVLPAGSLFSAGRNELYVAKDVRAFRQRSEGRSGGQGLFVQGNYRGSLSSLGEEIRLVDQEGQLIASEAYAGQPSVWQQHLVISEFLPDPDEGGAEFIKLENRGAESLDLTGVRFSRGVSFAFEAGTTLAPSEFVLLVRDVGAFEGAYGQGLPVSGAFAEGSRLNNGGETLKLEDPANNTVAEFRYGTEAPWPSVPEGHSFVFTGASHADAADEPGSLWAASAQAGGDPGVAGGVPGKGGGSAELLVEAFGTSNPRPQIERSASSLELVYSLTPASEIFAFTLERSEDLAGWEKVALEAEVADEELRFQLTSEVTGQAFFRVLVQKD